MKWTIKINHDESYIEVVTAGIADRDGSMEMAKVIGQTMRKNKITKALIDHRNIEKVSGTVVEIYERPKLFKIIGLVLGIKIAEIVKPEHIEHFKFLETVCVNRGFTFSVFNDRQTAMKWLIPKPRRT